MWANGRITEREQDDSIGHVSVDWVVNDVILFTFTKHVDTKDAAVKNAFKAQAIAEKDAYLAKKAKEVNIGNQINTFMNA